MMTACKNIYGEAEIFLEGFFEKIFNEIKAAMHCRRAANTVIYSGKSLPLAADILAARH